MVKLNKFNSYGFVSLFIVFIYFICVVYFIAIKYTSTLLQTFNGFGYILFVLLIIFLFVCLKYSTKLDTLFYSLSIILLVVFYISNLSLNYYVENHSYDF